MADRLDVLVEFSDNALQSESEAITTHNGTGEKYLVAIGIILGFHIVEMKDLVFFDGAVKLAFSALSLAGVAILLLSMAVTLWSMRVRKYPTYPQTKDLMPLCNTGSDDEVKSRLLDTNLCLRDGIREVNEKRAGLLRTAGALLMVGFLVSVIGQIGLKLS